MHTGSSSFHASARTCSLVVMLRSTPTQALRSMACLCARRYDACAVAETQNKCKNVKYSKTVLDPQTCNLHRNHAASNCAAAPHMRHVCIKSELVRLNPNSHNAQICVHYTCGRMRGWSRHVPACAPSLRVREHVLAYMPGARATAHADTHHLHCCTRPRTYFNCFHSAATYPILRGGIISKKTRREAMSELSPQN